MLTISRLNATDYSVVTDTVLSDGTMRSANRPGLIRVGGGIVVKLGPKAQADLEALPVGASITR